MLLYNWLGGCVPLGVQATALYVPIPKPVLEVLYTISGAALTVTNAYLALTATPPASEGEIVDAMISWLPQALAILADQSLNAELDDVPELVKVIVDSTVAVAELFVGLEDL
jgi:hypothetical protein